MAAIGALLAAAAVVPAGATVQDTPPEQPCYAGQPAAETQLVGVGPTGVRWTVTLTQAADAAIANAQMGSNLTEPVVTGGLAFVAMQSRLLAVRTADGVTLWSTPLTDNPQQAFLDGNRVVLASAQTVTAFDRTSGTPAWTRTVEGGVTGNTALTGRHGLALSTGRGRTEVINLGNGSVRWTSSTHGGVDPVLATSTTVVRIDPQYLEAFDAVTGKRLWHRATTATPVITNGIVVTILTGRHYVLGGLDLRTGAIRWRSTGFAQPLAAGDGGVLGNTATRVVFVNARTGRQIWSARGQVQLNAAQISFGKGVVADVENGANVNQAVGHRITDGHVVWHAPQADGGGIGTAITSTPNTLVATGAGNTTGTGTVTRYDTRTGRASWTAATPLLPQGVAVADGSDAVVVDESLQCATGTVPVTG